jgi:two-component system nitrogen regulation sensor histidine kinase GlnL
MTTRELNNSVLDSLSTAVLVTDAECGVDFINTAAEDLFGVSARKARQLNLAEIPVDGGPRTLRECLQRKQAEGQTYTFREITIKPPGTDERVVNCTVTPLIREAGGDGMLVELTRVDRILKIALEEQLMSQHLTAREIARGLAHEINNPLGGLRGAAQLLEQELPEAGREYTRVIISEADRLQKLVQSILGPHSPPDKHDVNIHEVLDHVIKLIRAESREHCEFIVDFDPSIPTLPADRDQLVQAVLNIARNAWQAVRELDDGAITLKTRVHRSFTIGHVFHRLVLRVDVVDNGPGIPEDKLKQIFYPMVTGRPEGTGLGLTIAQSLVSLHGGLIECHSNPGETIFSILLPFDPPSEPT